MKKYALCVVVVMFTGCLGIDEQLRIEEDKAFWDYHKARYTRYIEQDPELTQEDRTKLLFSLTLHTMAIEGQ